MTVLVTGATGFLGRHLVSLLLSRGESVRALVRPGQQADDVHRLGAEVVRGNILDRVAMCGAARGCGLVFHLAGVVAHEDRDLPRLAAVNVEGTRVLLEAAGQEARIVHVSSVAAIGPAPAADRLADERQPFPSWANRLPYAATKRAGEELALGAAECGADVVVANPGFLLGPGDVHRISTWAIGRYLHGALRFHAPGGLSFVDVRDVAAGLIAAAQRGRAGERYILTSREGNLSHQELFRRVAAVTGVRRRMLPLPSRLVILATSLIPWPVKPGEARAAVHWWFYDPAKAEVEIGFRTRPLDETLAATAAQYIGT